ncbi:MAG: hypothetical protein AB8G22_25630, partial [Saprospiraceae bacterium]
MKNINIILIGTLFFQLISCQSNSNSAFKNALTFYVSFDQGTKADYALGDPNIYTADSRDSLDGMQVGMNNSDYQIVKGKGQFGDAFEFGKMSDKFVFYQSKDNITYDSKNWSGTISFWLSLDPATDLEPVYNDPIQITDTRFNDASIWVDFTDK